MYTIKTQTFTGPFDLLLQLIRDRELDITEVSLAKIADQFVVYLKQLEQRHPEELADFIVVAAELLYLKSRALLPLPPEEEEASQLKEQLELFELFWERSEWIRKQWEKKKLFPRPFVSFKSMVKEQPADSVRIKTLADAFQQVIGKLRQTAVALPVEQLARRVSVEERIAHLKNLLARRVRLSFSDIIRSGDRSLVIASFLALLELIKQKHCAAQQQNLFDTISFARIK